MWETWNSYTYSKLCAKLDKEFILYNYCIASNFQGTQVFKVSADLFCATKIMLLKMFKLFGNPWYGLETNQ